MRAPWLTWRWPIIILLSTIAVTLLTFWFPEMELRPVVIMCFLFLIPGMTIVRFFHMGETAVEWMLAIALSFAIDAFVAGIILYARQWSPVHIMSFLIGFCFSGAVAQLAILRSAATVTRPVSLDNKDAKEKVDVDGEEAKNGAISIDTKDVGEREVEIDFENSEDPEDTKERPAVSLHFQEDTQEKTVPLKKPEFARKETSRG